MAHALGSGVCDEATRLLVEKTGNTELMSRWHAARQDEAGIRAAAALRRRWMGLP